MFTKDLNVYSKDALRTHRVKGEDSDSSMKGELCFGPLTPITFVASTNHASNRFQQIMSSILIFVFSRTHIRYLIKIICNPSNPNIILTV